MIIKATAAFFSHKITVLENLNFDPEKSWEIPGKCIRKKCGKTYLNHFCSVWIYKHFGRNVYNLSSRLYRLHN